MRDDAFIKYHTNKNFLKELKCNLGIKQSKTLQKCQKWLKKIIEDNKPIQNNIG